MMVVAFGREGPRRNRKRNDTDNKRRDPGVEAAIQRGCFLSVGVMLRFLGVGSLGRDWSAVSRGIKVFEVARCISCSPRLELRYGMSRDSK